MPKSARHIEALGGRLDIVANPGVKTIHLPVTTTRPPPDSRPVCR
jgi:hypothetical protein